MNAAAAEKIAEAARRIRETRAEVERAPAGEAKAKAMAAIERVAFDFATGIRARVHPK